MKRIIVLLLTLALIVLAGCSAGAGVDESFKVRVEPVAENILQGIRNGDRESFLKDMDDKMKSVFTQESFTEMNDKLASKIGSYQSKEYWKAEKSGDYRIAYFKAKFDKEEDYVVVKVVTSEKNGTLYVSGLFFDSPNLRK
jgi:mRNA-degrading endonuclease RelE of RelBE toxin-antitoxin system